MDLGFPGLQADQHSAQSHRVRTERRPRPVVTGGGRIALVEDQVDDPEDGLEPGRELVGGWQLNRTRGRSGSSSPGRSAAPSWSPGQERPGDLPGLQPAEGAQRQGDLGVEAEDGMAGGEDQPEQIVGDGGVELLVDVGHRVLPGFGGGLLVSEELELAVQVLLPAVAVGGEVLGGRHQPGRRMVRNAVPRPLLQGDLEGVLGEILGGGKVSGDPGERRDEAA